MSGNIRKGVNQCFAESCGCKVRLPKATIQTRVKGQYSTTRARSLDDSELRLAAGSCSDMLKYRVWTGLHWEHVM